MHVWGEASKNSTPKGVGVEQASASELGRLKQKVEKLASDLQAEKKKSADLKKKLQAAHATAKKAASSGTSEVASFAKQICDKEMANRCEAAKKKTSKAKVGCYCGTFELLTVELICTMHCHSHSSAEAKD